MKGKLRERRRTKTREKPREKSREKSKGKSMEKSRGNQGQQSREKSRGKSREKLRGIGPSGPRMRAQKTRKIHLFFLRFLQIPSPKCLLICSPNGPAIPFLIRFSPRYRASLWAFGRRQGGAEKLQDCRAFGWLSRT